MRWIAALVVTLCLAAPASAQNAPGPAGTPQGPWREQDYWIPMNDNGVPRLLYSVVCRPPGEGKSRVAIIAHGSPPSDAARPGMRPTSCSSEAAQWFLTRGYVVIAAMRRGYGQTGGPWAETYGSCNNADYFDAGLQTVRDYAAIVDYAATLPFAQPQGMVLVGHSAGGWGTIAYDSVGHPRVSALVNMAGGRGGHMSEQPNTNCHPELLATVAGRYGRTAATPMIWIYAANDSFFSPSIASAMYAAFSQSGGKADFNAVGPYGNDGHGLFFARGGSAIWGPLVERYLATRPPQ